MKRRKKSRKCVKFFDHGEIEFGGIRWEWATLNLDSFKGSGGHACRPWSNCEPISFTTTSGLCNLWLFWYFSFFTTIPHILQNERDIRKEKRRVYIRCNVLELVYQVIWTKLMNLTHNVVFITSYMNKYT